jgi:hypothetical protein
MRLPLLAVFGGDDRLVPVEPSVGGLRETVPTDLLHLEVFAGADHRIQVNGSFADGYLSALAAFVDMTGTSGRQP